jgi:hypothetical protein
MIDSPDHAYEDALAQTDQNTIVGKDQREDSGDTIVSDELTVLQAANRESRISLLIGYLGGMKQLVRCEISNGAASRGLHSLKFHCLMDRVLLQPGDTRESEWLRLDSGDNPFQEIEDYVRIKSRYLGATATPYPPSVFCTWYFYGEMVTEQDVIADLEGLREHHIEADVFQIDEGWERRWGDWEANHRFPSGMKAASRRIAEAGYRPGIWTCPFLAEPRSDLAFHRESWLLRRENGEPVRFRMNNMDNLVLDITRPDVLSWIEHLYGKLTEKWGYTYHKIDFTRAAVLDERAIYHDRTVTRAEAYRRAIESIRRGVGPHSYMLICGGLYSPSAGLVQAQRTSSDVVGMWNSSISRRREVSCPRTIKQNVLRYWMNSFWHNDADALMLHRNDKKVRGQHLSLGLFTDDEALLMTLNQYFAGGLVCFTLPGKYVDEDRVALLRHIVPSIGKAAVPRDLFCGRHTPTIFDVEVRCSASELGTWHTVSVVNWSDAVIVPSVRFDENLVGTFARTHKHYCVSEFFSQTIQEYVRCGDSLPVEEIRPHSALHYRVAPQFSDRPQLLYTNGHFSMGATEVRSWIFDGIRLAFDVDWKWDGRLDLVFAAPEKFGWDRIPANSRTDGHRLMISIPKPFHGTMHADLRQTGYNSRGGKPLTEEGR